MKILVVEDHPTELKLAVQVLSAAGFEVDEAAAADEASAANGAEGLAILDLEQIDIIISDIFMPVMDGYRFCYEVRRSERHRHIPFIVYTSTYLSPSDEKLSLDLGADCYLRKPTSINEIR